MKKLFSVIISFFLVANCAFAVDYSKYNVSDINAIRKATKAYQNEFKNKKGTKEAEEEFLKFRDFYARAVMEQSEKIKINEPEQLYKDSYYWQARKYTEKYSVYGLKVNFNGEFYITTNMEYLYMKFSPYLAEDLQELLMYNAILDSKAMYWDGAYSISKEELLQIIEFYKNFNKKYPNSVHKQRVNEIIQSYEKDLKTFPYINLNP